MAEPVTKRILVVERQAAVARLIRRLLERAGYLADETPDCDVLLRMAGERRYDLVLASLESMEPSPSAAIARVKEAGVPLLLMTGGAEQEVMGKAVLSGACKIIAKPFDPDALMAMVRDILR